MNIHHLELFYYVARLGGITRAAGRMPYSITQPAVSRELLALEEDIGMPLFHRRPFALTSVGRELYEHSQVFFEGIEAICRRLHTKGAPRLRIAASELVAREYLPPVIAEMQHATPEIQFSLRAGSQRQIRTWLREDEIDIGITALNAREPEGIGTHPLLDVQPVLLVPEQSEYTSAAWFWSRKHIDVSLVLPVQEECLERSFAKGLQAMSIIWPTNIEAGSTAMVSWYVAAGNRVGVALDHPSLTPHPRVRRLPLPGFDVVTMGVLWRPSESEHQHRMIRLIQEAARAIASPAKR